MSGVIKGTVSETATLTGRASALLARDGDSAYVVACKNGFEGTEAEWLESLKGEQGEAPVRGVDYWTEEDKAEIEKYIDSLVASGGGSILPATVE